MSLNKLGRRKEGVRERRRKEGVRERRKRGQGIAVRSCPV